MSDLELERKESLSRAQAAKRLSTFAEALAAGGKVERPAYPGLMPHGSTR